MARAGLGRSLEALYEAADLDQLRERLTAHLTNRGYLGVCEIVNPLQIPETRPIRITPVWDNFADLVGHRRADLLAAYGPAPLSFGAEEESRRLAVLARQVRPYLSQSGELAGFKAQYERNGIARDFGLRAVECLAVPFPDGGAGRLRMWSWVEDKNALRNAEEVAALMMTYHHMRQLLDTKGIQSAGLPTPIGEAVLAPPSRDPMHTPIQAGRMGAPDLIQGALTRDQAVRAHIEEHLHDPALGVDQLCRMFAISRRTVYRMFARDGGLTRYLTERRLIRAFGELSVALPSRGLISATAARHGFVDQNHFSRLFRARFHIPPTDAVSLALARLAPASLKGGSPTDAAGGLPARDQTSGAG